MKRTNASRRTFLAKASLGIPSLFVVFPDGVRLEAAPPKPSAHPSTAIRYRDSLIERIQLVRRENAEILDKIAEIGVKTVTGGHRCYAYMHAGHTHNADNFEGRIGLPKLFIPLGGPDFSLIREGDLLVCSSGDNPPLTEVIKKKRATLVSWTFPYGGDAHKLFERVDTERAKRLYENRLSPYAAYMIDTFQEPHDGTIDIPGIRSKFGAQSGPLVMSMFWMITLRIVERLAAQGIELEVYT